ncbi:MAG: ABC transporter ATP-binding protein, partial [Sphingobacteriales bacterium]
SNIIMVSHDLNDLTRNCDVAFVVMNGEAQYFENMEQAIEVYKQHALAKK